MLKGNPVGNVSGHPLVNFLEGVRGIGCYRVSEGIGIHSTQFRRGVVGNFENNKNFP
jgi:hypothetical protein